MLYPKPDTEILKIIYIYNKINNIRDYDVEHSETSPYPSTDDLDIEDFDLSDSYITIGGKMVLLSASPVDELPF